jgi:hypothetical protein
MPAAARAVLRARRRAHAHACMRGRRPEPRRPSPCRTCRRRARHGHRRVCRAAHDGATLLLLRAAPGLGRRGAAAGARARGARRAAGAGRRGAALRRRGARPGLPEPRRRHPLAPQQLAAGNAVLLQGAHSPGLEQALASPLARRGRPLACSCDGFGVQNQQRRVVDAGDGSAWQRSCVVGPRGRGRGFWCRVSGSGPLRVPLCDRMARVARRDAPACGTQGAGDRAWRLGAPWRGPFASTAATEPRPGAGRGRRACGPPPAVRPPPCACGGRPQSGGPVGHRGAPPASPHAGPPCARSRSLKGVATAVHANVMTVKGVGVGGAHLEPAYAGRWGYHLACAVQGRKEAAAAAGRVGAQQVRAKATEPRRARRRVRVHGRAAQVIGGRGARPPPGGWSKTNGGRKPRRRARQARRGDARGGIRALSSSCCAARASPASTGSARTSPTCCSSGGRPPAWACTCPRRRRSRGCH